MNSFIKSNKALIASILTIAFPAIMEMALNTLVGLADTIMISRMVGTDALSASGYANQVIFTIIFIFSSFNIGATALIARSYGEKNYVKMNKVMGQNLTLNVLIGLVITILNLTLGSHMMRIFDTTPQVFGMSLSYLNIVSFSQFFMFFSFAAAASLRGVEDTKTPMFITGLVNILNIIGNYILISGFWIFPQMGIRGAALSTTISRAIGALLYLIIIIKGSGELKLIFSNIKLSRHVLRPLWKLSSTAGLEQFLMQTSFFAVGIIISLLDTTSEAAFRIMLTIESCSFMPAIGFSIAAATLVGKALGENDHDKAVNTGFISFGIGFLWGILAALIFNAFPSQILSVFTDDPAIVEGAVTGLRWAGFDQPLYAFILILSGSLRGAGDTKSVMIISSLRLWIVFVPLTYIFVAYAGVGVKSVWISEIISLFIFNAIMLKRFLNKKWLYIQV